MNLTLREIAVLSGGELSPHSNPDLVIKEVVIDSRNVKDNSLFVAIQGDNHDGHSFAAAVLSQFDSAVIVDEAYNIRLPNLIYVKDTVKALGNLGSNYRDRFSIALVGITGSNGKTTVKEMLKSVCIEEFSEEQVLANVGNLNNHLGMPLTLLKLNHTHKVAIIEMGMNHKGEIDYLSRLAKPTMAVVNNVMLAHAGFFKDITEIAEAKGEIYHGLNADGIACVNLADKFHYVWDNDIPKVARRFEFGTENTGLYLKSGNSEGETCIATPKGEVNTKLRILGKHNQVNAVTVAALAINLGCSLESIAKGLANYTGYKRRLQRKTAFNGALIIDDSYNANLESVKAAILAIQDLPKPHWMILGDLRELGDLAEEIHYEVGYFAKVHGIDKLLTVGKLAKLAGESFAEGNLHFASNEDVVEYCMQNLPTYATVLVKGSLSTNLEYVVNKLEKTIFCS